MTYGNTTKSKCHCTINVYSGVFVAAEATALRCGSPAGRTLYYCIENCVPYAIKPSGGSHCGVRNFIAKAILFHSDGGETMKGYAIFKAEPVPRCKNLRSGGQ